MNYKVKNADNSGNDIYVINDVVDYSDTTGWYFAFNLWGSWKKNQIFYNQNPPILAMDTDIEGATYVVMDEFNHPQKQVDPSKVTGTQERTLWFINLSKKEACQKYKESIEEQRKIQPKGLSGGGAFVQASDNEVRVKGLTSENLKITEQIVPKPFKVGNYEVTQEMIDNAEDPDIFKTMGIEDTMIADNVYDIHPEVSRLGDLIYDIYRPVCEEIIGKKFKKSCTNAYLNRNAYGDSVWTHRDPADYSLVVYLNPIGYDLRKWGGETMFYNNDLTFCRGAVSPKGTTACLFKSEIPHKVTGVSWEADFDRMAITYFMEFDDEG